jgi:nitrite reductase/ring-hydroxylating ferredoxin subunit
MLLNGKPRAFADVCIHHRGPLTRGGDTLTCQWHGAQHDIRTGRVIAGPHRPDARLITLPTRIEDGILTYVYDGIKSEDPQHTREAVERGKEGGLNSPV